MNSYTQLIQLISRCKEKNFTGRITFQSQKKIKWQLYFSLGDLIWLNGGFLPYRSWFRHLKKYTNNLQNHQFSLKEYRQLEFFPGSSFTTLSKRYLLESISLAPMLNNRMLEIFFDLLQTGKNQCLQMEIDPGFDDGFVAEELKQYWNFVNAEQLIAKAQHSLAFCSLNNVDPFLNLAPKVTKKKDSLAYSVPNLSGKFVCLFDGKSTIRDLTLMLNQDAIQLSISLLPSIRKGWLELVEVEDLREKSNTVVSKKNNNYLPVATNVSIEREEIGNSTRCTQLVEPRKTGIGNRR